MSKIFSLDSSESLTKISDQNALEYLALWVRFVMDRIIDARIFGAARAGNKSKNLSTCTVEK